MSVCIVTTTINRPVLLQAYCENARAHGHKDVQFVIIGDKKTPPDVGAYCATLSNDYGYQVDYLDVDAQLSYLASYPELGEHLPFNSIQRRNIGLLIGYQTGRDVIVTIDDDNLVGEDDYFGAHGDVGNSIERDSISSDTGWFNVCEMLEEEAGRPFYHRGYPMEQRWSDGETFRDRRKARVVVNAGLWLNDPDIDAVTRLDMPIRTVGVRPELPERLLLASGTWCPFNSQNTALAREVIPAYFLSPYVGRYDDIWASYFLRKIVDHLGDAVQYGQPLVTQERNVHNLWVDLDKERDGMQLTDRLVSMLRGLQLEEETYGACFQELTEGVSSAVLVSDSFDANAKKFIGDALQGMRVWSGIFAEAAEGRRVD